MAGGKAPGHSHGAVGAPGGAQRSSGRGWNFRRQLSSAVGDIRKIREIVREAEVNTESQNALCEIYAAAMRSCGPCPLQVAPEDYGELCAKRFLLLCKVDPEEARLFHSFLGKYKIRSKDAELYLARAEMEVRNACPARAVATLEAGLRIGAEPAASLQEFLRRVQADSATSSHAKASQHTSHTSTGPASTASDTVAAPLRPRMLSYGGEGPSLDGASGSNGSGADGADVCAGAAAAVAPQAQTQRGGPASGPANQTTGSSGPSELATPPKPSASQRRSTSPGNGRWRVHAGGADNNALAPEWTRFSVAVDNLSPIMEADSVEDQSSTDVADHQCAEARSRRPPDSSACAAPPVAPGNVVVAAGASCPPAADADLSDLSIATDCSVKPPKVILVNGVAYTRVRTIGRGGSSKVYQVQSPSGESLALKRVVASCDAHFEALANEVTLLQHLKDCPNVIQVHDAEVIPDRLVIHIVMEQGGMDLGRLLQTEPEMGLGDIQALWRQMLEAVQVIHSERIVHSDLKPGNFLLAGGRLKVIDFGIAKRISHDTTNIMRETSMGTISYMAPEALVQGTIKLGRPADIWSLGIILYQMVYRRSPFAHLEPMQRLFALTNPDTVVEFPAGHRLENYSESTKADMLDVLTRCLQRDPRKRPSIPQLLEHPFLRDSLRITRAVFDRTMEVLVTGFYRAAMGVLCPEEGQQDSAPNRTTDADVEGMSADCRHRWQSLSDEVWDRMFQGHDGDHNQAPDGELELPGLMPFQECLQRWVAHGVKRQRLALEPSSLDRAEPLAQQNDSLPPIASLESPRELLRCGTTAPGASSGSQRPVAPRVTRPAVQPAPAAAPAPTALPARSSTPTPPALSAPSVRSSAPALSAPSAPPAPQLPSGPLPATAARVAKVMRGLGGAALAGPSLIQAEMLQHQRSRLRKVAPPAKDAPGGRGREHAKPAGQAAQDNVVLRRLKERSAFMADDKADEEMTGVTNWADAPGGLAGTGGA